MKTLFFALLLLAARSAHAQTITLEIPDLDIRTVEDDVPDAEQWIRDAWEGKLSKSKSRVIAREVQFCRENDEALPAGESAIIEQYLNRPGYKSRAERTDE